MGQGFGIQSYIRIQKEVTWGTDPAGTRTNCRIVSSDSHNKGTLTQGNRGLGRFGRKGIKTKQRRFGGDFVFDAQYEGLEEFLRACCGDYTHAIFSTSAHRHTFKLKALTRPSLTIEEHLGPEAYKMTGWKGGSLHFLATNELLEITASGLGRPAGAPIAYVDPSGLTFSSAPDVQAIEGTPGTQGIITKLGGSAMDMTQVEFTVDIPLTEDRERLGYDYINEPLISDLPTISGTITREYIDSPSWATYFNANTAAKLELQYVCATNIPGSSPLVPYKFLITLYEIVLQEALPPVAGPGYLMEAYPFTARIDSTDNFFDIIVENNLAVLP